MNAFFLNKNNIVNLTLIYTLSFLFTETRETAHPLFTIKKENSSFPHSTYTQTVPMTILHAIISPPRHSYTTAVTKSIRIVSYRSHSSTTPNTSNHSSSSTTTHTHIHNHSNNDGSNKTAAAERAYLKKHQHLRPYSSLNCNTPYNLCFLRHGQSTCKRNDE